MTDSSKEPVGAPVSGPGAELKSGRIKKGLSVEEVADAMHLRPSIVAAIEDEDYDLLPGVIFLKGYVRTYSKIVGVDEQRAIVMLERQLASIAEGQAAANSKASSKGKKGALISLIVVALLVSGIAAAYFLGFINIADKDTGASPTVETTSMNQAASEVAGDAVVDDSGAVPATESENKPVVVEAEVATALVEEVAGEEPQIEEMTQVESVDSQPPVVVEAVAEVVESTSVEPQAESTPAVVSTGDASTVDASTVDMSTVDIVEASPADNVGILSISFKDDCWVRVTNGENIRVVNALKRKGQKVEYSGPTPFKVVVGAVSAAEIQFNGLPIKVEKSQIRNNRAELKLGSGS